MSNRCYRFGRVRGPAAGRGSGVSRRLPALLAVAALLAAASLAALAASFVLSGCTLGRAQGQQETRALPVTLSPVVRGDMVVLASVPGKVAARSEVTLSSKVPGRVAEVAVGLGDRVEAGQLLLRLEAGDMEAQVRQAQAVLDASRANLARLQKGARPQELEQAQAHADQAHAAYENALANYQRMEQLWAEGAVSQQQFEAARLQLQTAQSAYTAAMQQLSLVKEGSGVEALAAASAQVRQAQAAVDLASSQLQSARLVAPSAGLVAACNAEAGELVSPGVPLFTLVDIDRVAIEVGLGQELVNLVSPGQELEVRLPSAGEAPVKARVTAVGPSADPRSRAFPARLEADNAGHRLKPGMFCQVLVVQSSRQGALLVPQEALLESEGQCRAFVAEGGFARERRVEVGLKDGTRAEVLSGLELGDRVVVAGQHYLRDGSPIQAVEQ